MAARVDLGSGPASTSTEPQTDAAPRRPRQTPSRSRKQRSVFGRMFRGLGWLAATPVHWSGSDRILRSAGFIGNLLTALRGRPHRSEGLKALDGGGLDLDAAAFVDGLSAHQLQARLAARRRETARIAYTTFALAWGFLLAWVWRALETPWSAARVTMAVEFLPFCAVFFLVAFHNALLNFQVRIGRMASWREYLETTEPFWPR